MANQVKPSLRLVRIVNYGCGRGMRRNAANTFKLYTKESNKCQSKHLWLVTLYVLLFSKIHEAADDRLIISYIFRTT